MAYWQTSNRPLSELMLIQFIVAYVGHQALTNQNEFDLAAELRICHFSMIWSIVKI